MTVCRHSPMPLICSEDSLTRNDEEPDELLEFEELRDVSLVTDAFFMVFCVAVRLHSVEKKKKSTRQKVNIIIQNVDVRWITII